jgi:pimeloyl-ACP methyl ester carboxylesterase
MSANRATCARLLWTLAVSLLLVPGHPAALDAQAAGQRSAPRLPGARVESHRVNGADLYVERLGSGPPLVLLHGFFGCGATWAPHVERLAERYQLLVPDLRGHGRSSFPDKQYSHRQTGRDLLGLLDKLGLTRVRALGISSGGMTLLHAAVSQPERFEALTLIGATSEFPPEARAIMSQTTSLETIPPDVVADMRSCVAGGEPQMLDLVRTFNGFKDSYNDMNLTAKDLARITAPTLIVHGDRDPFFPVRIPAAIYAALPTAQLWIVPNGDHVPIYGEHEAWFQAEVLRFLAPLR